MVKRGVPHIEMWGINRVYKYLESLEKFGVNLGLERITYLLEKLGNPHQRFKSIHVAGTNGKGSTAVMISAMLKEAGYRVGLYTSPHLFDYRERIQINGRLISRKDMGEGLRRMKREVKGLRGKRGNPTVFEVLTAVAFWYFAKKKVDYAVVEVGLGGRLDATNVLRPLVSVITNIDYEHTEVLGKTLAKIAAEKAAIIKPGIPVVTAENKAEPLKVIKDVCGEKGSFLIGVSREEGGSRRPKTESRKQRTEHRELRGKHQGRNAACAIAAIRLAQIKISRSAIRKGLQKARWPGRFQIVSRKPLIIVDGAHNPAGAKALRVTIEEALPGKYNVVFGCQRSKDFKKIIKELRPVASCLIITQSSHPQAADPDVLFKYVKSQSMPAALTFSLRDAIRAWDKRAPLLITGSLFAVADALKILDVLLKP